ncbi:MAG TPA: tetratricopeptide repeat protein [Ruminococcus sp.]|nr:tetratricopeptide repeat protein [Ruminococcus sp.]
MTFLTMLGMRAKRVLICLIRSLPKALCVMSFFIMSMVVYHAVIIKEESIPLAEVSAVMTAVFLIALMVFLGAELMKYSSSNAFHRYDEDLIGKAFTGLNKKSLLFENGLDLFHKGHFRTALEFFTDAGDDKFTLSQEEKGVLEFYRGRCYNILGTYPNAVICYDKAADAGFSTPVLPLFTARCCVGNGDIERAKQIYNGLLDTDYEHADMIRTEFGKLYLKQNDGKNALKWFQEAIDRHENYADALGGAAIAQNMLHNFKEGEELYRAALLNNISDPVSYSNYYKEIQAAALLETHTDAKA